MTKAVIDFEKGTFDKVDNGFNTDNHISIETPDGGRPIWLLMITYRSDILGSLQFSNAQSLNLFKKTLESLPANEWGSIQIDFDTAPNDKK